MMRWSTIALLLVAVLAGGCALVKKDRARRAIEGPPGTVWLYTNIYIDQTEVTNFDWLEYLRHVGREKGVSSPEYQAVLPDTTVWFNAPGDQESMTGMYLRHPAYRDYPVVGISREQAMGYCAWRTARVKELYANNPKLSRKWEDAFSYRLPTEREWEAAAKAGLELADHPHGYEQTKGKKGLHKVICREYFTDHPTDTLPRVLPVRAGGMNKYNFYNMSGNVSEMVQDENVSKGGSWNHTLEQCKVRNQLPYMEPTYWLGFRCAVEVTR